MSSRSSDVAGLGGAGGTSGSAVIVSSGLGIRFSRTRRRVRVREMVARGRSRLMPRDEFWALRGVSFAVAPGESVGLVGPNGGGKSTLLRLVAGGLVPDEGSVECRAGVAPMIELQAGFASELTVRDNIWLTGGLHGLSKAQVAERFDAMVAFAEVGRFLDSPVRHLSSGLRARLGFAVMTHLNDPVVLVDEVLAVGDAAFRDKCYRRFENLLEEGRTLVLVSHEEDDLLRFCSHGLYLREGCLVADGPMGDVLARYRADQERDRERDLP